MLITRNNVEIDDVVYTYNDTYEFTMDDFDQGSVQLVCTNVTPDAVTFTDTDVDTDEDTVTIADHGLFTGLKVVTTTSGSAPGGLTAGTYYVIVIDDSTIKFASSASNAFAGTAVNITSAGGVGDTQTVTPSALGTCAIDLYASNDGTNYVTLSVGTGNFTNTTVKLLPILDKFYKHLQLVLTVPAGALKVKATVYGKQY